MHLETPFGFTTKGPCTNNRTIIFTGDRPTGPLHPGHCVGSLRQHATLQYGYQQFILVANLQGLTSNGSTPQKIRNNIPEVLADYFAAGIDPSPTTICLRSVLPALVELTAFYMNTITVTRVEHSPTVKNEIAQKGLARLLPVGSLVYLISQTADIAAFEAEVVPVGDDQLPVIRQTNEIVYKMNSLLSALVLSRCKAPLSETSRLPGIDRNAKMSGSLDNTLLLLVSEETIHRAVSTMYTDPNHLKMPDQGQTDGNIVFTYLDAFYPDEAKAAEMKAHYQQGGLGGRTYKNELGVCLQELIAPMHKRRVTYAQDKSMLMAMLKKESEQAYKVTQQTLGEAKQGLDLPVP